MTTAALIVRLGLSLTFGLSAAAKWLERADLPSALVQIGVRERWSAPIAKLLAPIELVLAVGLLLRTTAWAASIAATVLLVAFTAVVVTNLARGRHPDCHCFGALSRGAIGWRTLLRNAFLACMAVWLVAKHSSAPVTRLLESSVSPGIRSFLVALLFLAGILLTAQGWVLWHLLRKYGEVLLRLRSLESGKPDQSYRRTSAPGHGRQLTVGSSAPNFVLPSVNGRNLTLADLTSAGKPTLLVFADADCPPCRALLPRLSQWQHDYSETITIAIISNTTSGGFATEVSDYGLTNVAIEDNRSVADAFDARVTPSAVVVGPDRRVWSGLAQGEPQIGELLSEYISPSMAATATGYDAASIAG
jgi:peroxiredoxin